MCIDVYHRACNGKVAFREDDNKWRVTGYSVNKRLLHIRGDDKQAP